MRIIRHIYLHPVIAPLCGSIVFFIFFFLCLTPIYETNDDVFMMLIANGYYTGSPSSYIIYSNIILGSIYAKLYALYPGINWYSVFLYSVGFVSLYTSLFILFNRIKNNFIFKISLCFIGIFYLRFFLFLQYTTISALACTNGIILFLTLTENKTISFRKTHYIISMLLIITSFLIRDKACYLIIVISMPIIMRTLITQYKKQTILPTLMFICAVTISLIWLKHINMQAYTYRSDWKNYSQFFRAGDAFHGIEFFSYTQYKDIYRKVRWSNNDALMIYAWLFHDPKIFSEKKVQEVADLITKRSLSLTNVRYAFFAFLGTGILYIVYITLVTLQIFILYKNKYPKLLIYTILIPCVVIFYYSYLRIVPARVVLPIHFFIGFIAILWLPNDRIFSSTKKNIHILAVFILCISMLFFNLIIFENIQNKHKISQFNQLINHLPENTFIVESGFRYEWLPVLKNINSFGNRYILIGGWTLRSPNYYTILDKFKIHNLYESFYKDHTVALIAPIYHAELMKRFLKEHYNKNIKFEVIKNYKRYGFDINLYKISET